MRKLLNKMLDAKTETLFSYVICVSLSIIVLSAAAIGGQ